jgi:uncharacterized protein
VVDPDRLAAGQVRVSAPSGKRGVRAVIVLAILLFVLAPGAPALATVTFPSKPPAEHFYADAAGLIDEREGREIDVIAAALLREEKIPLIVVTIPSLAAQGAAGYTIERYAYELFNAWGIGFADRNYGMLLLVSAADRRARIELGAGWGHAHNLQAQEVMNTLIVPEFKQGRFSEGILAGVRGMDAMARGLQLPKPEQPWWVMPLVLGVIALTIGVIISLFRNGQRGWGWALLAALGVLLFFILRAAAKSGGSGGAFGGGSSGGGGASGSW